MASKARSMRLDDNDWKELKRVGKLGRMDRTRFMREITANVTPRIKTREDLRRFLNGDLQSPQIVNPQAAASGSSAQDKANT